jgi:hypothetical protein
LEAESSAVFSTVIWLMMPGIYPVALPRVNFAECGGLDTSELRAVAMSPKLCSRSAGAESESCAI